MDGVLKQRDTFEIIRPQKIGLEQSQIMLTSRSGRHAVRHRLAELGYELSPEEIESTYQRFLARHQLSELSPHDLRRLIVLLLDDPHVRDVARLSVVRQVARDPGGKKG